MGKTRRKTAIGQRKPTYSRPRRAMKPQLVVKNDHNAILLDLLSQSAQETRQNARKSRFRGRWRAQDVKKRGNRAQLSTHVVVHDTEH